MAVINSIFIAFVYFAACASAVPYAGAVGVDWTVPSGQFTYVTSTLIVPTHLVQDLQQGYAWGKVSTTMRRESQTIGKGVVVDSGGGGTSLTYFEQYSDTLYPGDEVKSTYTKDMSNVTYGVWTLRVDVKRGPEGITAGATNVVHSEMWDGWRGGFHYNTMPTIVSIGSFVHAGSWVPRPIVFKDIVFKSTTPDYNWCSDYSALSTPAEDHTPTRGWTWTNGPSGSEIPGGTKCVLQGLSFRDPPLQG